LKITVIEAKTLSEAWFQALHRIQTEGSEYKIERGSYEGLKRKELDDAVIRI